MRAKFPFLHNILDTLIQPTKEEQYKQKIAELEAKVADQEMEIDILKKLRALRQQRGENKH